MVPKRWRTSAPACATASRAVCSMGLPCTPLIGAARALALAARALRHESPDAVDGLTGLGEHAGEPLKHVNHGLPRLERHVDTGLARSFREPGRVVKQRFGGADLNE